MYFLFCILYITLCINSNLLFRVRGPVINQCGPRTGIVYILYQCSSRVFSPGYCAAYSVSEGFVPCQGRNDPGWLSQTTPHVVTCSAGHDLKNSLP